MLVARLFSGFNMNAMKFLLPVWIAPLGCVTLRLVFGAAVFWTIGLFCKSEASSAADRLRLFLIGAFAVFGYMSLYAVGLSMTTPISLAIFNAMQPLWVFILSALFLGERVTAGRVSGLAAGFAGALLCVLSQPSSDIASNPLLGNTSGLFCSLCYAVYIVLSAKVLRRVGNITLLRYTFLGAAVPSLVVTCFTGLDAPLFHAPFDGTAIAAMAYVLLFPTVLGYLLIPVGMKYLPPTVVSVYGYLTLFVAAVVSLLMGTDRLTPALAAALLLICYSMYSVSRTPSAQ